MTHFVTFLSGALLAYLFFQHEPPTRVKSDYSLTNTSEVQNPLMAESHSEEKDYLQIIVAKDKEITKLKSQLSNFISKQLKQPTSNNNENLEIQLAEETDQETNQETSSLKKMSFQDFEETMKDSFSDRFKGIILELSGKKLDDIKRSFQQSSDSNEWSVQYEDSIAAFLQENDLNGDHFIQSLSCNPSVCRLEVNTNNPESWNSLYASMTEQEWYESITIQENSDYPGNVIYYLPSFRN